MELARNQVILFKNTKRTNKQPHWIGTINVDGEVRKILQWFRMAKSNGEFYLLGESESITRNVKESLELIKILEKRIEALKDEIKNNNYKNKKSSLSIPPQKKRFMPENPYDDGNSGGQPPF